MYDLINKIGLQTALESFDTDDYTVIFFEDEGVAPYVGINLVECMRKHIHLFNEENPEVYIDRENFFVSFIDGLHYQIDKIFVSEHDAWDYLVYGSNFKFAVLYADEGGYSLRDIENPCVLASISANRIITEEAQTFIDDLVGRVEIAEADNNLIMKGAE
jgi:hypothetical protein